MVLLWDNIRCFFGNIKLTESDNIWCYYMLKKCVFLTILYKNGTINDVL